MSRFKKTSLIAIALLALVIAGGYISAYLAQPRIEQQVRAYVLAQKISGFDLSGPVPPRKIEVYSEVRLPFLCCAAGLACQLLSNELLGSSMGHLRALKRRDSPCLA